MEKPNLLRNDSWQDLEIRASGEDPLAIQRPGFDDKSNVVAENNQVQSLDTQQNGWKATVHLENMTEFQMTAQQISGKTFDFSSKLPTLIDVVAFVNSEETMKYIAKADSIDWMELIIVKLAPADVKDVEPLVALYEHLKTIKCLGVANVLTGSVNQIYLMPCLGDVPPVVESIIGKVMEKNLSTFLLGIIIGTKDSSTQVAASVIEEMARLGTGFQQGLLQYDSSFAGSSNDG